MPGSTLLNILEVWNKGILLNYWRVFRNILHVFMCVLFLNHLRYLCKLSDQELRQSAARNMADLMWSTVKEPLDTTLCFDKESLDLAFKYFMSPTLTMRLAGLSQITVSYIDSLGVIFYLPSMLHHHHHHPLPPHSYYL